MQYRKFLLLIIILVFSGSCRLFGNDVQYGVIPVKISDTVTVYFIRTVWGLLGNADYTFLSPRRNLCELFDKKDEMAYQFNVTGETSFYYRVRNQKLDIYTRYTLNPPRKENFPVEVIVHTLTMQEFEWLYSQVNELGLKEGKLETDPRLKCGLFGISSGP